MIRYIEASIDLPYLVSNSGQGQESIIKQPLVTSATLGLVLDSLNDMHCITEARHTDQL